MSLYEHAERELRLIGCGEPERSALLAAVKGFATGGWSGGSAPWGVATLEKLLRFQPLSDIGTTQDEWVHIADERTNGESVWQNSRRGTTFSRDGGRTWYDIENPEYNNGDVWVRENGEWEDLELGSNVHVGSRVRVRLNAFSAETRLATLHNGRVGDVLLVDAGRVVVKYDDGTEFRFPPTTLEVLKTPV